MKTFFGKHYAWAMVAGAFVYLMVTWGIVFNANSLFLVPIEETLGIGREQTLLAITIRGVAMSVGAFAASPLYTRFRFMQVWRIASMLLVASFASLAFMQNTIQYYVLSGLHITLITIAGFIPVTMLVNRWFAGKTGSAMGLALMGSAAGGMIFSPIAGQLIPLFGWRWVYGGFALIMLVTVVFLTFFVFVEDPEQAGLSPYGRDLKDRPEPHTIPPEPQPLGRLVFVFIVLGIVLMNAGLNVLINNTAPYLQDTGMGIEYASLVMTVIMISMAIGKILLGILYDGIGMRNATTLTALAFVFGFAGLLYYQLPLAIWISALGTGFGSAFNSLAPPIFARALYGVGQFTKVNAFFQAMGGVGAVAAPLLVAFLYGHTGNYSFIFRLFLAAIGLSVLIWWFVLPGKKP